MTMNFVVIIYKILYRGDEMEDQHHYNDDHGHKDTFNRMIMTKTSPMTPLSTARGGSTDGAGGREPAWVSSD